MKILIRLTLLALVLLGIYQAGELIADKNELTNNLIRMHVVANSDTQSDQSVKLEVKDAICAYLQPAMEKLENKEMAQEYILNHMDEIKQVAQQVLTDLGKTAKVTVSMTKEAFDTREYDTFSLPSGVYDSLRIVIGEGEGKNWWCVAFPTLCVPRTADDFTDAAVSSGFSDTITGTIQREEKYEIRFYLLDLIGRIENFFS